MDIHISIRDLNLLNIKHLTYLVFHQNNERNFSHNNLSYLLNLCMMQEIIFWVYEMQIYLSQNHKSVLKDEYLL